LLRLLFYRLIVYLMKVVSDAIISLLASPFPLRSRILGSTTGVEVLLRGGVTALFS
jgi:hypothetical protein